MLLFAILEYTRIGALIAIIAKNEIAAVFYLYINKINLYISFR